MDAVSKDVLCLSATPADGLEGLLCEGASKVIRHIFPTKLTDSDIAQAQEVAKKSFASLNLQTVMSTCSPELRQVCALLGVPSEPSLEDLNAAVEAATAAQKVVDGKRVTNNCLAIFALSKVGKAFVKTCAVSLEARAKDNVKVAEAQRASEKIKEFSVPETIEMTTAEEVKNLVSDLCDAFAGFSAGHVGDACKAKAACDDVEETLTQVVVKAACQWSEQIGAEAIEDSERCNASAVNAETYEQQAKVLQAASRIWDEWHTQKRAIVLKEQEQQPTDYVPMGHFVDAVATCAKTLKGQEFDKELATVPDQVVIAFGKRLLASTSDWAPMERFCSEVVAKADWLGQDKRSHFDCCAGWLKTVLNLALEQISLHLTQTFAHDAVDALAVRLPMLANCWAEDGSLLPGSDVVKATAKVDLPAELIKIDALAGASKILAAVSRDQKEQQDISISPPALLKSLKLRVRLRCDLNNTDTADT